MPLRTTLSVVLCHISLLSMSAVAAEDRTPPRAEIRLAEDYRADDLIEAKIAGTEDRIYLHQSVVATGDDIAEASVTADAHGKPAIAISLTDDGSKKLAIVSGDHIGKRLAILVDGKVLSAPTIRDRMSKEAEISGDFTVREAAEIAKAFNAKSGIDSAATNTESPVVVPQFVDLFNGVDLSGWVNVNTAPDTWQVRDGLLVCSGKPIGVMRSEKQYENFVLHIEWRHMQAGGNSGVFVWSEGSVPEGRRLPKGMEVQMLELDWVNKHRRPNGDPQHIGYVSGELFGAGGLTATPDNPRGRRSMSRELRCRGAGEWNVYDVVCVDGTVKLSINGRFVNSIRDSSVRKGYLCLESEGAEIHFRNIRILELPPGMTTPAQTAPHVK